MIGGTERIARQLNKEEIPTNRNGKWTGTKIRGIVKNEKYTGDVLLQKTYTDEHFNRKVNQSELNQYLIENHHEAIITHADFEAANRMLEYQASQKNVAVGSRKYLNRYPFSGKIECAGCGDTFKRRIHTSTHRKYITWCCSTHIKNKDDFPSLISKELFEKVKIERYKRAKKLGRLNKKQEETPFEIPTFTLPSIDIKHDNPYKQAEYVYSLIESVVT